MYCNQCEQTARGTACTAGGVCGKDPQTAALQDVLLYSVRGLSVYLQEARKRGIISPEMNRFSIKCLFATLTNVNFDPQALFNLVQENVKLRETIKLQLGDNAPLFADPAAKFIPANTLDGLALQGLEVEKALFTDAAASPDIQSLQQLLLYGLKGVAAYAYHAAILGQEDDKVYAFIHEAMALLGSAQMELSAWLEWVLKCGEINLLAMELLDRANTSTLGHPQPHSVPLGHRPGKCILVSGHDMQDLLVLLKETEGTGISIYTHGEMLPAHGYPELNKYSQLYGHYGTAWQNQRKEFADFPGAILMTTNCIQEPQESYKGNIFTTGPVGWPGVEHISGSFQKVIDKAMSLPGFMEETDNGSVTVGFARHTVMGAAQQVIQAVNNGDLRHIFLVGGCDGARGARSYYTEFVEKAPQDTAILTLGCGKFRFFDKQLGNIGPLPRLMDMGQCNDAYSAIQVAVALSNAFECGVNDLPLSLVLSWYEQKAVSILLTLLYLGIKNIRIGPTLPAFISPNVLNIMIENYGLQLITSPEEDIKTLLGSNGAGQ